MERYTQAVCGDGAVILLDGEKLNIEEILGLLNGYESQQKKEIELIRDMLRKCDAEAGK